MIKMVKNGRKTRKEYYGLDWRQWNQVKAQKHFKQYGMCPVCQQDVDFKGCEGHHDNRNPKDQRDCNLFIVHKTCHIWVHSRNLSVEELIRCRKNGNTPSKIGSAKAVVVKSTNDVDIGL